MNSDPSYHASTFLFATSAFACWSLLENKKWLRAVAEEQERERVGGERREGGGSFEKATPPSFGKGGPSSTTTTSSWLSRWLPWSSSSKQQPSRRSSSPSKDKVVLITGCDSGFGEMLAREASRAGYTVVAACYGPEGARALQQEEDNVVAVVADLATPEGRSKVVRAARRESTRPSSFRRGLYALVNNAGVAFPGYVEYTLPEYYRKSMELNFHAPVELTYELLPLLKKGSRDAAGDFCGRIVNVTSVAGFVPLPSNAPYNCSKYALEAFSDTLRCELLPYDVSVVVVEPSTTKTPMVKRFADSFRRVYERALPDRKAAYGPDWIEKTYKVTAETLDAAEGDPAVVVNDLMDALTLLDPPTRMLSGDAAKTFFKPTSLLPDRERDEFLWKVIPATHGVPRDLRTRRWRQPPVDRVAYVSIRVTDLDKSASFYRTVLGLRKSFCRDEGGEDEDGGIDERPVVIGRTRQQFLVPRVTRSTDEGEHRSWSPLLLLVEDDTMPTPRTPCYDIGMTRLCAYTTNLDAEVERLESLGIRTLYPVAVDPDGFGKIASYTDPDGFFVYLIEFGGHGGCNMRDWQQKHGISGPWMFDWTINVSNSSKANEMFEGIGFSARSDQDRHQVVDSFLPAFGLPGYPETIIEHVRIAGMDGDNFNVTIMEWMKPRSQTKGGHELSSSLAVSVENVDAALAKAKEAGMLVKQPSAQTVTLPFYGQVLVGTAFVEDDSNRVDFISF